MFKKRVLWHLPFAMIGGVETLYKTILKYIDYENYDHYVTCHVDIYDWVREQYPSLAHVNKFFGPLDLSREIESISPDLIIGTHGLTLYSALDICEKQYPVVEVVHGSHIWSEHNVHMPKKYTKHIVAVSKSAEEVYLKNSSFNIDTSIILNGVDTEIFHPRRAFRSTAQNFAYFGRFLESDKKITKIIQAFRSLGSQHANLYLIGGTNQEIIGLKRYAQKLKLGSSIKFFGHTPRPELFYKDIDIVTVRSEAEGYCNVVAEAMASGVPVVAYNFGGILRHLSPDTVLVANSQKEYALHLSKIYRDAKLRDEMIVKGFKFIKTKGNAKIMANNYEKLFQDILGHDIIVRNTDHKIEMPVVGHVSVIKSNPTVGVANPHWHGIYTSTCNCCDVVVPWHNNPSVLAKNIVRYKPRHILFSGGCPGFIDTAKKLRKKYPQYPVSCFYHGGASHFSFAGGIFGKGERDALTEMISAHKAGIYEKIAVASPGLAEVGQKMGIKLVFTGNVLKNMPTRRKNLLKQEFINIGNFNRHLDHKHTSIGLAASMLIPNARIHMLNCNYRLPFVDYSKVQFHDEMPQERLYDLYQEMHVCLQMSFIETFNVSVLEMWGHGVPVILGPGNYIFCKHNDLLAEYVYVHDHTNPVEVAGKIKLCAANRDKVVELQDQALEILNQEAITRWQEFFA